MKLFSLLIALICASSSSAYAREPLLHVDFRGSAKTDSYTIEKSAKTHSYILVFRRAHSPARQRAITEAQAKSITAEATRLIWESAYRQPASGACHPYANLHAGLEKAKVCRENEQATGMVYGLLNSLRAFF